MLDSDATPVLKLWDLRSSTSCPVAECTGHSKGILDVVWNTQDNTFVATTGRDNKVLVWDVKAHAVLGDLTEGEEKAEIPTDAADFFTTVARAASATRKTQVCWNETNPAVIATASSDGMIVLYNVEGVSCHAGKHAEPSVAYCAVNGCENRFHGKVLSVTDLICGNDVKEEIERFEAVMRGGDLKGYCEAMKRVCEDKEENELWSFMEVALVCVCEV